VTKRFGQAGRPRVVIVDDDPDLVDRIAQLLEEDCEVLATTDWGELNRLYFREGCALVLMDVNLPVLRGDRLVHILRGQAPAGGRRVPILFFSAADEDQVAKLVRETGADGWISKSLRGADIKAAILRHLPPAPAKG
jgi:DNA-binding response OmpR family regulator